jgi:GDPmannose 4,6-dehydratase
LPRALITGIRGQDGRYLSKFLCGKGYKVFGLVHDVSFEDPRLAHEHPGVRLVPGDLTDVATLIRACEVAQPDEVYNLGAQSRVDLSFREPAASMNATAYGAQNVLDAIRTLHSTVPSVKFYQASSSEMFGDAGPLPYSEATPFHPQSPYAIAKLTAHHTTRMYREAYGMFAATGICFNHESPWRSQEFVSRKISMTVASINAGLQPNLVLGNLDSLRDWGFARDYIEAMWLILQHSEPDDFVISTGEAHSVREFVDLAFSRIGIHDWREKVIQDPNLFRPLDPDLCGDSSKAREVLGWKPTKSFEQLVHMMVDADMRQIPTADKGQDWLRGLCNARLRSPLCRQRSNGSRSPGPDEPIVRRRRRTGRLRPCRGKSIYRGRLRGRELPQQVLARHRCLPPVTLMRRGRAASTERLGSAARLP